MVWSGEFEEMEQAEGRLMVIVPLAAGFDLHAALHRLPFVAGRLVVLSNVIVLSMGGIWASG